jgi:circadian clock protein KaiC
VMVIDPISAFRGPGTEVHAVLLRMVDLLKSRGITTMFTSLRTDGTLQEGSDQGLSSLMDAWVRLMDIEANGERNSVLYVIKARGMSHSNQVREYRITSAGIELIQPYVGPEGVLTGTARLAQETREQAAALRHQQQIGELHADLETVEQEARTLLAEDGARENALINSRVAIAARRGAAE